MQFDDQIKTQLSQYLSLIENEITITLSLDDNENSKDMKAFVEEIKTYSDKINVIESQLERTPSFKIGERITFAGIPMGHEFTSFIMALLQSSGRKPKVSDDIIERIKSITEPHKFETFVSLSCHNCPDVVQALNIMSVLNPKISHTMIDGALFQEEVNKKEIMAVPSVYLNDKFFESGRMLIEEILNKIGNKKTTTINKEYDVLIIGGGPAGASAAIYAARKGIKTAIVAERFGGQVMDTLGIENLIGTSYTEGPKLVSSLEEHVKQYDVDIFNFELAKNITKDSKITVELDSGVKISTKTAIISTGARWRNLGVPGEKEFKNKGVAYCPHCDGPLFKGKHVAVIGGGNSGVEAAIDLAGIVSHVTLIEFGTELKADKVLQERLKSLTNTTIITNAQTKEITGSNVVDGITYIDRTTQKETHIELQGVFVQIGLVPNTDWIQNVEKTKFGELIVNNHGETNIPGIFAAGDCTNTPYKQIIISMGSGANAALGAFDYLIRN